MSYSFIIPVYNNKVESIERCINSIIIQNLDNYEIIIINDGSTDIQLNNYCRKVLKKNRKIKYFEENNSGSAVARNLGIENVCSDYIIFVDADDELEHSFFSRIKSIKLGDVSIFDYCFVDNDIETIYTLEKPNLDFENDINDIFSNICFYPGKMNDFMFGSIWGKVFSAKYIKDNNILFIPRLRKSQDRVFMLYSFGNTDKINYYPLTMYKYKFNHDSITHKMNFRMNDYYNYLYEEIMKFANDYKLDESVTKFLSYNILNELLPLTIFNINYKKKYLAIKKELIDLIKRYNIDESIKKIKYSDIPTKKGKIKFFFYKHKLYYLLYKIFYYIQMKENNRLIK